MITQDSERPNEEASIKASYSSSHNVTYVHGDVGATLSSSANIRRMRRMSALWQNGKNQQHHGPDA